MSGSIILSVCIGVLVLGLIIRLGLPRLLTALGLHPHYELPAIDASGKRALIVTTSHDTLGDSGKATGVFASEMTAPYYAFLDSGMDVDIASIGGGDVPIEPQSLRWPVVSAPDKRFMSDEAFKAKTGDSVAISELDAEAYDVIFLAGGWGAAYDFGQSAELGKTITKAYSNGAVVGGVCHGLLGLLQAKSEAGTPLVEGRRISAVTDKQISELGITHTPMHPERDLRAAGAVFEANSGFRDIFANKVVIDGRLVTGQNQNSGTETAVKMMKVMLSLSEV
ncbi:MAG: type 1 glutamine amidotransferase domain-containing protein [Pseudomonadota bacterium]